MWTLRFTCLQLQRYVALHLADLVPTCPLLFLVWHFFGSCGSPFSSISGRRRCSIYLLHSFYIRLISFVSHCSNSRTTELTPFFWGCAAHEPRSNSVRSGEVQGLPAFFPRIPTEVGPFLHFLFVNLAVPGIKIKGMVDRFLIIFGMLLQMTCRSTEIPEICRSVELGAPFLKSYWSSLPSISWHAGVLNTGWMDGWM